MMRSLFIASSGMQGQQFNLDVISNNLANVNTTGFKKSRADFQSLVYQSIKKPVHSETGFFNPTGVEAGNGVRVIGTLKEFAQGIPQETGNELDLSIEGQGFFMVQMPNGEAGYTRDGAFRIDGEGYLVNANGYYLVSPEGNEATDPSVTVDGKSMKRIKPETETNEIHISEKGVVTTEEESGDNAPVIYLANFINPAALESQGSNIYKANDVCGEISIEEPTEEGLGFVQSGFLEGSNVKVVEEMVKMIIAQRAYEINSKSIQTSDEILGMTNNLKR